MPRSLDGYTIFRLKDPLYIFPVLMGISMFVQQKMTPAAGMDPTQAKMMLLMPVVFSFIMISLPSGLTIYIFLSTLMGILQQISMNRERKSTPQLFQFPQTDRRSRSAMGRRENLDLSQTIFALTTGNLPSAVAVERVSGPEAFALARKIFTPMGGNLSKSLAGWFWVSYMMSMERKLIGH